MKKKRKNDLKFLRRGLLVEKGFIKLSVDL